MKYGEVCYITRISRYGKFTIKYRFRIDPVPWICKLSSYSAYLRRMRTTQERRMSFAYPEYTRAKRNFRNLPNYWDDWYRSNIYDECWKRTKKRKQWM